VTHFFTGPSKQRDTVSFDRMHAPSAISWASKLLATVAAPAMEAQYAESGLAAEGELWLLSTVKQAHW
jgi:hypothetical protein